MVKRDESFGPPQVMSGANVDPRVARYQQGAQQRRVPQGPEKYTEPVAGGKGPPIPHLEAPAQTGMNMADQANQQRIPQGQGSIMQAPTQDGIMHTDLLPEAARQDPAFREGQGSMFAANQPHMAKKYGVIRNGRPIAAQQLFAPPSAAGGALKQQTVEGLEAVAKFNENRKKIESGDQKLEDDAAAGPAGAAAAAGNGPGDRDIKPIDAETIKARINDMDDFDFAAFRQAMLKDLLNNDDQRKIIEDRLPPLDITDLILEGRCIQTVPIIPGKFEPEFQSLTAEEDLALKRIVMEETKSLAATEQYMLDKFSVMSITCSVRSINKKPLPDHLDKDGNFNDELFRKKFQLVVKYPFHMIGSLGLNFFWFDVRVRKLFVAEAIKNG